MGVMKTNRVNVLIILALTFVFLSIDGTGYAGDNDLSSFKIHEQDQKNSIATRDVENELVTNDVSGLVNGLSEENDGSRSPTYFYQIGRGNSDYARDVIATSDGGCALIGYIAGYGAGSTDILICKFDSSGALTWAKTVGTATNDEMTTLRQTSDGGYIGVGTLNNGTNSDIVLIKFTSSGTVSWARTAAGSTYDIGSTVDQTSDLGYIVLGYSMSFGAGQMDWVLLRYDSGGNLTWAKSTGGSLNDIPYSVKETSDSGYIGFGYTSSYGAGSTDFLLVKYTSAGALSWARTLGGTSAEEGYCVRQTSDGGYITTGATTSYGTACDILLAKFDSGGSISWARNMGSASNERGRRIEPTSDGNWVLTGETNGYSSSFDVFISKLDSSGSVLWANIYPLSSVDTGTSVSQAADGGFFATSYGWTPSASDEIFLIKTDSSGGIPGCSYVTSISPGSATLSISATSVSPTISTITMTTAVSGLSAVDAVPTVTHLCDPPTSTSTSSPTETPTSTLTVTPTETPSGTPTETPTDTPSQIPTLTPTDLPSITPTESPTEVPTLLPTEIPTETPIETASPTATATPPLPVPVMGQFGLFLLVIVLSLGLVGYKKA